MARVDRILIGTSFALWGAVAYMHFHPAIRYVNAANIFMVQGYASTQELAKAVDEATEICLQPPGASRDQRLRAFAAANPDLLVTCRDSQLQLST